MVPVHFLFCKSSWLLLSLQQSKKPLPSAGEGRSFVYTYLDDGAGADSDFFEALTWCERICSIEVCGQ